MLWIVIMRELSAVDSGLNGKPVVNAYFLVFDRH